MGLSKIRVLNEKRPINLVIDSVIVVGSHQYDGVTDF
jgi:hypothetical protein